MRQQADDCLHCSHLCGVAESATFASCVEQSNSSSSNKLSSNSNRNRLLHHREGGRCWLVCALWPASSQHQWCRAACAL